MQLAVLGRPGTALEYFYMKIMLLMDVPGLQWTTWDSRMVEAAGIEPASVSPPQSGLHT